MARAKTNIMCTVAGCEKKAVCTQMCQMHYVRVRKHGSTTLPPKPTWVRPNCSVPGCENAAIAKSLCDKHYNRLKTTGSLDPRTNLVRFWSYVDQSAGPDACWPWNSCRSPSGYGVFGVRRRSWRAHRFVWLMTHGPIADGMVICHHCDNPPCVNPAHLFIGTSEDNSRDSKAKGRQAKGERAGLAKLNEAQVREIRHRLSTGETPRQMSELFGVHYNCVAAILHRKTWKHLL